MKRLNVAITVTSVLALIAAVFFIPLPHAVKCSFEVQPRNAKPVYVSVPGEVAGDGLAVEPGQTVSTEQLIAQLENLDVEHDYHVALGAVAEAESELEALGRQRIINENVSLKIDNAKKALETAKEILAEKEKDRERLRLTAPTQGVIIPPPPRKEQSSKLDGRLPHWSGSPFDEKNRHAWYNTSDMICMVHNPTDGLEASLVIDQAEVELVNVGDAVRILLDANTSHAYESKIEAISSDEMKFAPPTLSSQAGGRVDTRTDMSTGMQVPLSTSYQARAPLPEDDGDWQVGIQGQARIYTGWKTIAWRVGRYLSRTFHFEL